MELMSNKKTLTRDERLKSHWDTANRRGRGHPYFVGRGGGRSYFVGGGIVSWSPDTDKGRKAKLHWNTASRRGGGCPYFVGGGIVSWSLTQRI